MYRKFFTLLTAIALTACVEPSAPPRPSIISFKQYTPIHFNVAKIEVVEEYQSPLRAPNVEHIMPYSPADAVNFWVKDRLRALGGTKTMQVIVKDGRVVEKDLPTQGGVSGLFTNEINKEYNARLEVEIRVYGDGALSEANVNVISERTLRLPENISPAQRDNAFRSMITELMNATNAELEKNIFQHFSPYINYDFRP